MEAEKTDENPKPKKLPVGKMKAIRASIAFSLKQTHGDDMKFSNIPLKEMEMFMGNISYEKARQIAAFLQVNNIFPKHMDTIIEILTRETGKEMTLKEIDAIYKHLTHIQGRIVTEMAKEKDDRRKINYWGYHLSSKTNKYVLAMLRKG